MAQRRRPHRREEASKAALNHFKNSSPSFFPSLAWPLCPPFLLSHSLQQEASLFAPTIQRRRRRRGLLLRLPSPSDSPHISFQRVPPSLVLFSQSQSVAKREEEAGGGRRNMSLERVCVCTVYGKRDPLPPFPLTTHCGKRKEKKRRKGFCCVRSLPFPSSHRANSPTDIVVDTTRTPPTCLSFTPPFLETGFPCFPLFLACMVLVAGRRSHPLLLLFAGYRPKSPLSEV